jgi:hypothetical protein
MCFQSPFDTLRATLSKVEGSPVKPGIHHQPSGLFIFQTDPRDPRALLTRVIRAIR